MKRDVWYCDFCFGPISKDYRYTEPGWCPGWAFCRVDFDKFGAKLNRERSPK